MCGITGWIRWGKEIDKERFISLTRSLTHRGPDGEGFYYHDTSEYHVALGHRRLKIIDLVSGDQPMSNEEGNIWLVYNGEVYNFPALREELIKKGHQFRSRSDTEVIIHLYEEKGINLLESLNGMFAFALWDKNKEILFLARDRIGIKPLYYYSNGKEFAFASEIKPFLQLPDFEKKIDPESIHRYLTLQYIPSPLTIFKKVKKLPPGHYLTYHKGKIKISRYWNLDFLDTPDKGEKFYRDKLRQILEDATHIRLVSDVPFGAFLSGGIDSTIVVGTMQKFLSEPVKTFSMGFDVSSFNELLYARVVAKRFSTEHHEFKVKPPNVLQLLPVLTWHYDEPFADSSAIPTYMVSELARRFVTMVLSGDGGDEVFAGYHRYLAERILNIFFPLLFPFRLPLLKNLMQNLPETTRINDFSRRFKRLVARIELEPALRYLSWLVLFDEERRRELYSEDFLKKIKDIDPLESLNNYFNQISSSHLLSRSQFVDIMTYLPEDILTKVDRASMANSLECRVPLLDHRLVEFMALIPPNYKLKGFWMKYILKKTFRDLLPPRIYYRGKHGFGVPLGRWFREELHNFTWNTLTDKRFQSRGYFNPEKIRKLLEEHQRGQFDHSHRLWALLILELWHRFYIDNNFTYLPKDLKVEEL